VAVLTGFAALESYLIASDRRPITWYTRNLVSDYPHVAIPILALVAFVVGLLIAHFGWDQAF
jgi:hypothetical protein